MCGAVCGGPGRRTLRRRARARVDGSIHTPERVPLAAGLATQTVNESAMRRDLDQPEFDLDALIGADQHQSQRNAGLDQPDLNAGLGQPDFDVDLLAVNDNQQQEQRTGDSTDWAGLDLTFALINAKFLVSRAEKALLLYEELKAKGFPSLVVITELGCAKGYDLFEYFRGSGVLELYDLTWTARCCSVEGGPVVEKATVGGGVLMLTFKALDVDVQRFHWPVPAGDRKWLQGHMGVWRLTPREASLARAARKNARALRLATIVTAVYVPPASVPWGKAVRPIVFNALHASEVAIRELRRVHGTFHVVLGHFNAQDGGCSVPLVLDDGTARVAEIRASIDRARMVRVPGASLYGTIDITSEGALVLHRHKCNRAKKSTKDGRALVDSLSRCGMVPINGVTSARQPTTWSSCAVCAAIRPRCTCVRKVTMRNVNDVVFVPADSVVAALLAPAGVRRALTLVARRVDWAESIDHAVTTGKIFIGPAAAAASGMPEDGDGDNNLAPGDTEQVAAPVRRGRPLRLPANLLERARVLKAAANHFRLSRMRAPPSAVGSIDDLNTWLVTAIKEAHAAALESVLGEGGSKDCEPAAVRSARSAATAAVHALKQLTSAGVRSGVELTQAGRTARRAQSALARVRRECRAETMAVAHRDAPLDFWRMVLENQRDKGEPAEARCPLLLRLNDKFGGLITTEKKKIIARLLAHRREVFQIKKQLPESCERNLNEALVQNSLVNEEIVAAFSTISADSAAAQSARDPAAPVRSTDEQRQYLQRRLDFAILRKQAAACRNMERVRAVRARFHAQCAELERDITMTELKATLEASQSVGTGLDEVLIAAMRKFGDGDHNEDLEDMLALFNRVWNEGVIADPWRYNRLLLHFKGKGSDYYCVANYRGLGIGQSLSKILSLIMTKRLETFLTSTNALSHSQGGFLPARGTPEQVFTLTETCRVAVRGDRAGPIYLCFVDVERAYDSVLHQLLWKRCADLGIGGRFLTTLQALYHRAGAVLDVDGELLEAVPVQCGVLQGSPLSPLLFNIYFDPAIRALEKLGAERVARGEAPFGIPLPRVQLVRGSTRALDPNSGAQDDFMVSICFADDAGLIAMDVATLQLVLDTFAAALAECGLSLNVGKTKWMIVAPARSSETEYAELKRAALMTPLHVGGQAVELVDKFDYLGTMISWRLDWQDAWASARMDANNALYAARLGGFQRQGATLDSLLKHAHGKILCHFNTVAAVAGGGGIGKTAPWAANAVIVTETLREITSLRFADADALRLELGIWNTRDRIDELQLRLLAKLSTCAHDTTHYRALCLSMSTLTTEQRRRPDKYWSSRRCIHKQSFAQTALAAAARFGMDVSNTGVLALNPGLVAVQAESGGAIIDVANEAADLPHDARLRLVVAGAPPPAAHARDGVDCWYLPPGTSAAAALFDWSPERKAATKAALKERGNRHRQVAVHQWLRKQVEDNTSLKLYARIKSASYLEVYAHLPCWLARRVMQMRMDIGPYEGCLRRRGHNARGARPKLARLDPDERACYTCDTIFGVPGCWHPEHLHHLLLFCEAFVDVRDEFRTELRAIIAAASEAEALPPPPDVANNTSLLMCALLCTGLTHHAVQERPVPRVLPPNATELERAAERARADGSAGIELDSGAAIRATTWIGSVLATWSQSMRGHWARGADERSPTLSQPSLGRRLAECAARFLQRVVSRRRSLLRGRDDFLRRERDPDPPVALAAALPAVVLPPLPLEEP